jgi:ubiquinone/menaquinone biosynthesis C-methylase UbiE
MSGFDRLARPYRWMEYLSFGRALERCRFQFLPQLAHTQHALLLGDGDGRFAERLLRAMVDHKALPTTNDPTTSRTGPQCLASETWVSESTRVVAVDGSEAMLALLRSRCAFANSLLATYVADLSQGLPHALRNEHFDLITTHFFLDCLTTGEVEHLVTAVRPCLTADARWVISEFAVPTRGAMRLPAWIVVRGLYLSFRLLTGLRAQQLPDYRSAMLAHGLVLQEQSVMLGGLLTAELWRCGSALNR